MVELFAKAPLLDPEFEDFLGKTRHLDPTQDPFLPPPSPFSQAKRSLNYIENSKRHFRTLGTLPISVTYSIFVFTQPLNRYSLRATIDNTILTHFNCTFYFSLPHYCL